jgi:hypothetical protein
MPPSAMSSPLRIELQPSRLLRAALLLLASLALTALWLSAAPSWVMLAPPLLLALAWPRATSNPPRSLVLRGDGTAVELRGDDERDVVLLRLQRRGPLSVLTLGTGAERRTHLFTPETLPSQARRQLALWFERHVSSTASTSPVAHV